MMCHKATYSLFIALIILISSTFSFGQKFNFESIKKDNPEFIPLAIENNASHERFLNSQNIKVKYKSKSWIHFSAPPEFIENAVKQNQISDFYLEYAPPTLLDDTARVAHFINEVHDGEYPLPKGFTGKDVIIGVVDAGLDHDHPDFIDENGNKRLIRYWDHTILNEGNSPQPYNYGREWLPEDIITGAITSNETSSGHGTTVTGIASGNGRANGRNKGFAPDADIICVKTNFGLANWTLTIADACDYIFRVADELGKPAIVNLSLGTYLGSHDALDPAGVYIDELLDEKPGRLVVCAAGNSGNGGKFHVRNVINEDTSFVWFKSNPNGRFGANTIFFDLWSDDTEATFDYAFGVNLPNGNFEERSSTVFRTVSLPSSMTLIRDTLRNENGDHIGHIEIYQERVGTNYHMMGLLRNADSTDYLYSFKTTGSGSYDFWSGLFLNYSEIVDNVPSPAVFPPIANYAHPDFLQSIVSSWNCSEKVVSVGNMRNRLGHIDKNGNQYYPNNPTKPGEISLNSSRGPTRKGVVKPDIAATGDVTLAAAPAHILNNSGYNSIIDEGGFHARNGGTSMASPSVAGAAALYFEKCSSSSWSDFKQDLISSAIKDEQTGVTPNFSFGYGKLNALQLLARSNKKLDFVGDTVLCQSEIELSTSPNLENYFWSTEETSSSIVLDEETLLYVNGKGNDGCYYVSDTIFIEKSESPTKPEISYYENGFISSEGENYQWYRNDSKLHGETNQTLFPEEEGFYSVSFTNEAGCSSFSNALRYTLSLEHLTQNPIIIYPNPTTKDLNIFNVKETINMLRITDQTGRIIFDQHLNGSINETLKINVEDLSKGVYTLEIHAKDKLIPLKFIKQ